ncbi:MAG TPA: hypothetical protein VH678_25030 [Xanthobacteraceae bacterium]|jgi:hypothetical protein
MRKNISFGIAATILALAAILSVKSGVVASSAQVSRPAVSGQAGSLLPAGSIEPIW